MSNRVILKADAVFLGIASLGGLLAMDIPGVFFARGPLAAIGTTLPQAGMGFIEAHGLAFILAVLLWRATASRSWHLTGAAIHLLLGGANLVFWELFVSTGSLAAGYVTTILHGVFVVLQSYAATRSTVPPVT